MSCLSKTFTSVLNVRLCELSDEVGLISESQTGFRKGYSTLDNIFNLHALISIYMSLWNLLTAHLLTFQRLLTLLLAHHYGSNFKSQILPVTFLELFTVFMTMSSLVLRIMISFHHFFRCDIGVRQGENLRPFLFLLAIKITWNNFLLKRCKWFRKY